MPFVIGVHMSHGETVERFSESMNEVVFVNIDTGYCNYFDEDLSLLPPDIVVRLRYEWEWGVGRWVVWYSMVCYGMWYIAYYGVL